MRGTGDGMGPRRGSCSTRGGEGSISSRAAKVRARGACEGCRRENTHLNAVEAATDFDYDTLRR